MSRVCARARIDERQTKWRHRGNGRRRLETRSAREEATPV